MSMTTIDFKVVEWSTRRMYPAQAIPKGKKIELKFRYNKEILADIKGCEEATFDWDKKTWSCLAPEYSPRSRFVLGYVSNGTYPGTVANPYSVYDMPLRTDVKPRRDYVRQHQIEGFRHLVTRRRAHLAHEMGLGKSLEAMELLEWIKANVELPQGARDEELFWVVAPKAPLQAWQYELIKHNSTVRPKLIMCSDVAIGRAWAEAKFPPIALILDESSRFKSATSKRTQMVLDISKQMATHYCGTEFVVCMTGTPAPNDPTDWWSQTEICCPGYLRERNTNALRQRIAYLEKQEGAHGSYTKTLGWNGKELEILYKRLSGLVDIKLKKDCVDLPAKIYERVQVPVSKAVLNAARTIAQTEPSALRVLQALRQLSDGFQYKRDPDTGDILPTEWVGSPKLDALSDELDSLLSEEKFRVVVYAAFTESVDRVVNLCLEKGWGVIRVDGRGWAGLGGVAPTLQQFQDQDKNKPIAFVGNADSGGLGITLTASDVIIYYSNSFNYESRAQSEDRIHRIGMKGATIKDLIYLPTDLMVLNQLLFKKDVQLVTMGQIEGAFLEAMKKESQ